MQFTISKSAFLKELNFIQGVVEKKNTIPILSNLLIQTIDGGIQIKGTDLDVSILTICDAEIRKPGAVCIQAKKLFEIIRALPDAEIEIKSGEQEQVNITCERAKFKMLGVAKDNFPEIREFDGQYLSLPADLLTTLISKTIFAVTTEESRYALNGAKFEISGQNVRMVATDGHRLAFIQAKGGLLDKENLDVLIPRKTLTELAKLAAEADDSVEFGRDANHLFFKVGKRLLISRLLTGQFPNYELVLPKDNNNHAAIDCSRINSAVRRVALMADERSHSIKFDLSDANGGQISISSQAADVGDATDVVPVDYRGPQITAGFNAQYLLDFFNVASDGEVVFEFKDGNSQAQLKPANPGDYDFRYVIMPMRL